MQGPTSSPFIFHHHLPQHSHIASAAARSSKKKQKKSHSLYVRYQSTSCVGTSPVCPHWRSKRAVPLICCRSCVSEVLHQAFFFQTKLCARSFFFFWSPGANVTGHLNDVVGKLRFDSKSCDTRPLKLAATAKRLCSYTVWLVRRAKGRLEGHGDAKVWKSCKRLHRWSSSTAALQK